MNTSTSEATPVSVRFTFSIVWQGMLLGMAVIAAGLFVYNSLVAH